MTTLEWTKIVEMPDYPTGSWTVTHDPGSGWWTAQHQEKTGVITQAESWVELLAMMIDAELLWDDCGETLRSNGPEDHEERCYLAGYGESDY